MFRFFQFLSFICPVLAFLFGNTGQTSAQSILYAMPTLYAGQPGSIIRINLATCEVTVLADNLPVNDFRDFVLMPNGSIYLLGFNATNNAPAVFLLNTSTNTTTVLATIPGPAGCGGGMLQLDANTILITTLDVVSSFNILTGTLTVLGSIPGFLGYGEMFEYNGQIYTTQAGCGDYPNGTYILDLNSLTLTPAPLPGFPQIPLTSVCNQVINTDYPLGEFNMENGTINPLCFPNYPGGQNGYQSTAPDPFNSTGPLCNCTTESGNWADSPNFISVCGDQPITVPHLGDEVLDSDDNLVFVLSTSFNPPQMPSNILGVYSTPTIPFTPGVTQYDTYYVVYAVAGNAAGSGVNYNDPCLEISRGFAVQWRAAPEVEFLPSTNNCSTGCQTITAQFNGFAPFTLTYETRIGGTVQETITQVFNSYSATIEVCPPAGYTGPFDVSATNLLDATCTCGQ